MFLLCGCRPYVSIVWPSVFIVWVKSICYESYHLLQNHLLVGASLSAICFYCVGQNRLFLLCGSKPSARPSVMSHTICLSVCCKFVPPPQDREGTCWSYISSSN